MLHKQAYTGTATAVVEMPSGWHSLGTACADAAPALWPSRAYRICSTALRLGAPRHGKKHTCLLEQITLSCADAAGFIPIIMAHLPCKHLWAVCWL